MPTAVSFKYTYRETGPNGKERGNKVFLVLSRLILVLMDIQLWTRVFLTMEVTNNIIQLYNRIKMN